jgi:hypothetical protein
MIRVKTSGDFKHTDEFLQRMKRATYLKQLNRFGAQGVSALKHATPEETGATAEGWTYLIVQRPGYYSIQWLNTHVEDPGHIPVAILLQYGHGTRSGAYIQGIDYINPAMRPIFENIAAEAWKEVTK